MCLDGAPEVGKACRQSTDFLGAQCNAAHDRSQTCGMPRLEEGANLVGEAIGPSRSGNVFHGQVHGLSSFLRRTARAVLDCEHAADRTLAGRAGEASWTWAYCPACNESQSTAPVAGGSFNVSDFIHFPHGSQYALDAQKWPAPVMIPMTARHSPPKKNQLNACWTRLGPCLRAPLSLRK